MAEENKETKRVVLEVIDTEEGYQYNIGAKSSVAELASITGFLARILVKKGFIKDVTDFTNEVVKYATNDIYKTEE